MLSRVRRLKPTVKNKAQIKAAGLFRTYPLPFASANGLLERTDNNSFINDLIINTALMKHIIILGDGMADEPLPQFGGKTPLQMARKPNIDKLARLGRTGKLITVPDNMSPGSEIANLAVLGYDVEKVYEGRGVLEAASMGVSLGPGDLALRCNIMTLENSNIKNHSAGHISTAEASELIDLLNRELGTDEITFYPGVSYRHLLVMKNGSKEIGCTPPHDRPGAPFRDYLVRPLTKEAAGTAHKLNKLIMESQPLLEQHPVNLKRESEGKDPGNSIWLWSPGYKPVMPTMKDLFGINSAAVISAVDLIQGIGIYAGMEVIKVEGATGLYDTNYEGKAVAAVNALKSKDFVYLHVEASDEAGHEGDVELKTRTIEYLDSRVVKYITEETRKMDEDVAIAVLPDHPTPCATKVHTREAVPFLIYWPGVEPDSVEVFDEFSTLKGYYGQLTNGQFIRTFLGK
jgi:2,3-bisphosphoglycerate-independent phosphoglycerate mutase